MVPSSRCAGSLKPSVAYRVLNFCAGWKKQTTLPPLAYAGIPYQVLGETSGALALMMAWTRSARARSASCSSAIFSSTSLSPSAWAARGPRRAAVFSSWAWSFIAARSSAVNPRDVLLFEVVLLAGFCVSLIAGSSPLSLDRDDLMLGNRRGGGFFETDRLALGLLARHRRGHPLRDRRGRRCRAGRQPPGERQRHDADRRGGRERGRDAEPQVPARARGDSRAAHADAEIG